MMMCALKVNLKRSLSYNSEKSFCLSGGGAVLAPRAGLTTALISRLGELSSPLFAPEGVVAAPARRRRTSGNACATPIAGPERSDRTSGAECERVPIATTSRFRSTASRASIAAVFSVPRIPSSL